MSARRLLTAFGLVVVLSMALSGAVTVVAQPVSPPTDPAEQQVPEPQGLGDFAAGGPVQSDDGLWRMPADATPPAEGVDVPQSTGGPDDFGYTWDDSEPLNWIDASGGINTGINASVDHAGPFDIGFPFKYYENTYGQLFVSRFGFLAFNDTGIYNSQSRVPSAEKPDDVIAPHWVPTDRLDGYLRYLHGGTAPNRWFVVEWNRLVSEDPPDPPDVYTFEVVLHETGDIVFQYGTMTVQGGYWCQASGIEDSTGLDGLSITPFCQISCRQSRRAHYQTRAAARVKNPAAGARSFHCTGRDSFIPGDHPQHR